MKRFKEILSLLMEASEGDARKYMKKVLEAMGLDEDFIEEYGEHWSEQVFNEIRSKFIHNGCDVYFTPGLARIAYGELDMGSEDEDTDGLRRLGQIVRFITTAHKNDFSRNLEHITTIGQGPNKGQKQKSAPCTLDQLTDMFGKVQQQMTDADRAEFNKTQHTDTGYTIIELKDFETAHKYLRYTDLPGGDAWCYLQHEDTFDSYRRSGNRTYLALAPGFEKLKPGDQGYGRSMIGFDMGPVDENGHSPLEVCNNRYNHATDLEHENDKSGDSKYNEIELSRILGFPVWEKCPGYTEEELLKAGIVTKTYVVSRLNNSFYRDKIHAMMREYANETNKANDLRLDLYDSLLKQFEIRSDLITGDSYTLNKPVQTDNICAMKCSFLRVDDEDVYDDNTFICMLDFVYKPKTDELQIYSVDVHHSRDCMLVFDRDNTKFYDGTKSDEPLYICKSASFEDKHFADFPDYFRFCVMTTLEGRHIIYDTKKSTILADSNKTPFDSLIDHWENHSVVTLYSNGKAVKTIEQTNDKTVIVKTVHEKNDAVTILRKYAESLSEKLTQLIEDETTPDSDKFDEMQRYLNTIGENTDLNITLAIDFLSDVKDDDYKDWKYSTLICEFEDDVNAYAEVYMLYNISTHAVKFTLNQAVKKSIRKYDYAAHDYVYLI